MEELYSIISNNSNLNEIILDKMYPNTPFKSVTRKNKALKDIGWTLLYIAESFKANNIILLDEYFMWLTKLFKGLNINYDNIPLLLETIKTVLWEEYNSKELNVFLDKIILEEDKTLDELLNDNPYFEEQNIYLEALLSSDRIKAEELINNLIHNETSVEDIYIYIFQETMRKVGMLWHEGKISVGREHYCTAVTQYFMSTLYPYIFTNIKKERKLLACSVGPELHEMGIRMVADLFELNGWNTNYLGSNLPTSEIIQFAKEFKPDIIALSITMPYHLSLLTSVVKSIREDPDLSDIKIIVGGLPFINNSKLNDVVQADAVAINAKEGILLANEML